MTAPVVPFELQELVIDLVYDQNYWTTQATLCKCALTCRAWLPRSKLRLYQFLYFRDFSKRQLDQLLALIDTNPDVPAAIHDLTISSWTRNNRPYSMKELGIVPPVDVLDRFAQRKLPRLVSFTIVAPINIHGRFPNLASAWSSTLSSLIFSHVVVESIGTFHTMLAALPALRKLALVNVAWIRPGDAFSFDPVSLLPLTHVVWRYPDFQVGVEYAAHGAATLLCVLRAVCHSIEYLSLHDSRGECTTQALSHMRESPGGPLLFPRLSTVKLVETVDSALNTYTSGAPARNDLPHVLGVLQQQQPFLDILVAASQLRSVTFAYAFNDNTGVKMAPPTSNLPPQALLRGFQETSTDLEDSLLAPHLARLEAVAFELRDLRPTADASTEPLHPLVTSLRSSMEALFPRLQARGLLDVKYVTNDGRGVLCNHMDHRGVLKAIPVLDDNLHPFS